VVGAGRSLEGHLFGSDNFVTGGAPQVLNMGSFGGRGMPRRDVAAPHPELYEYWREGEAFRYAFPLADGKTSLGRSLDLDSAELGYGPPIGPAKNAADWTVDVSSANGYKPGEVVTYFCRIHPFMRGAFAVS